MNLVSSARAEFEILRTLPFGLIGAAYTGVGLKFANPVRLLKVTNNTDANLLVSFNGVDDQDIVVAYGFFLYDLCSNKTDAAGILELSAGKRLYVKQEAWAPTVGSVYATIIYASQV